MGIGISLFLLALGAVLTWAVTATVQGIDITAVGVILMIVGSIGLVLSMLFWASWAPFYRRDSRDREVREVHENLVQPSMPTTPRPGAQRPAVSVSANR